MLVKQIKESVDFLVDEILMGMDEDKGAIIWRNFIRRTRPYEIKFTEVLQGLFRQQEKEVISNMRKHPKGGYIDIIKTTKQNWLSEWLFAEMMWRKRFSNNGRPFIGGVLEDVGQAELDNLVVGIDFNISDPRVQEFLGDKLEKYSKDVNDTTLASLRKTLKQGVASGESIPDLQKRVQKVFSIADKTRATMIARTEVNSSANKATLEAYRQSGVVAKKQYLAAGDERTRPSHAAANGQTVALDKMFTLGSGVQTEAPGQSGVAAEDVNCRCTTVAIVKD